MRNKLSAIVNLVGILILGMFFVWQILAYIFNFYDMSAEILICYGIFAIFLIVCLWFSDIRVFSPFFVIVLYTILSHFGFVIVSLTDTDMVLDYLNTNRHVYIDYLARALQIASIGTICMMVGFKGRKRSKIEVIADYRGCNYTYDTDLEKKDKYLKFAIVVFSVYAVILLYLALRHNLFSAGYSTVKKVLSSSAIVVHFRALFWVSTIPVAIYMDKSVLKKVLVPTLIIFFVLMFTGNRNDVLYPLAIGYSLYCYKNNRTNKWVNLLALIILFVINPTISNSRSSGSILSARYSLSITDAIMEMGAQIRPLTVIISLLNRRAISHLWGMSIIAPTLAELNLGLIYSGESYRNSMYYIPNILAIDNHYGQGFSMISELWLNFGMIGVILLCLFIGYKCASIEKKCIDNKTLIKYGGWTMLLFYWARNSIQMNFEIVIFTYIMILICERVTIGRKE